MPFCPKCRAEYIPGVKQCKDCDVQLVDVLTQSGNTEQAEELICSECGTDISSGDLRCPKCGVAFSEDAEEDITVLPQQKPKKRNPFIAAILSLITPGLGQVYNGQLRNGIGLYLTILIFPFLFSLTKLQYEYAGIMSLVFTTSLFRLLIIGHAAWGTVRTKNFVPMTYHKTSVYLLVIILTTGFVYVDYLLLREALGIRACRSPTAPMEPTLLTGDCFVVRTDFYRKHSLKRGDIVAYQSPDRPRIRKVGRVAALEGDKVEIRHKSLFLNGDSCSEPYVQHTDPYEVEEPDKYQQRDNYGPFVVPPKCFFVMGDNRDNSYDSRFFGFVDLKALRGKALYIYYSSEDSHIGKTL
jgi:signal peptidase I